MIKLFNKFTNIGEYTCCLEKNLHKLTEKDFSTVFNSKLETLISKDVEIVTFKEKEYFVCHTLNHSYYAENFEQTVESTKKFFTWKETIKYLCSETQFHRKFYAANSSTTIYNVSREWEFRQF